MTPVASGCRSWFCKVDWPKLKSLISQSHIGFAIRRYVSGLHAINKLQRNFLHPVASTRACPVKDYTTAACMTFESDSQATNMHPAADGVVAIHD